MERFKIPRGYDKGYRTYDQVAERLKQLAAQAPEIATLVDIGDGWEKTQGKGDRDIWALHIKRGNGGQAGRALRRLPPCPRAGDA